MVLDSIISEVNKKQEYVYTYIYIVYLRAKSRSFRFVNSVES